MTAAGLAIIIILSLAMVSAVALQIWSILYLHGMMFPVGCIFGLRNPSLQCTFVSALILGEVKQAFNIGSLMALILVCAGIYIVNATRPNKG